MASDSLLQAARRTGLPRMKDLLAGAGLTRPGSLRQALAVLERTPAPIRRRRRPVPQNADEFDPTLIDLRSPRAHLPAWDSPPRGDRRRAANAQFDARAGAGVRAGVGVPGGVIVVPPTDNPGADNALLELKTYPENSAPDVLVVTAIALAAMAYADYFPDDTTGDSLRGQVDRAMLLAGPGWCGTYGPKIGSLAQGDTEGNYDMNQLTLVPLVYNFFWSLSPQARQRAITLLLARGRIHRASLDDTFTSGAAPNDWSRAGYVKFPGVKVRDIPETENHVLAIGSARYLTNQLLFALDGDPVHDNRRNGDAANGVPSCMAQLLGLLRNELIDGFAEYNAKNYQEETRQALLNLCSLAYDGEVRLAARMVLDMLSCCYAVSSCDLRRLVPFRRRNEDTKVKPHPWATGFMSVNLLDGDGGDPMSAAFALLAGNTRAYAKSWDNANVPGVGNTGGWWIGANYGVNFTAAALSDYRLPPAIHDLFVNDWSRRFYQRLHRTPLDEPGQQRNCDVEEIYAGSPSYLISAGGRPAQWVIPGFEGFGYEAQNLGVAMPISFMPTALPEFYIGSFDTLVLLVETGDDDLRENSSAEVTIHFRGRRADPAPLALEVPLKARGAGAWHNDSHVFSVPLPFRVGAADIVAIDIALASHPGTGETDDNWDLRQVTATLTSRDGRSTLVLRRPNLRASFDHPVVSLYPAGYAEAANLVQLLSFSDQPVLDHPGATENYGVAPDFACGFGIWLPPWTRIPQADDGVFRFFDSHNALGNGPAGFFLAVQQWQGFVVLEALDTWRHPEVSFTAFQEKVNGANGGLRLRSGVPVIYTTWCGNRIHFVVWTNTEIDDHVRGSKILAIEYAQGDPLDTLVEAGNPTDPASYLFGTVMRTPTPARIEIVNAVRGSGLSFDWTDPNHLVRVDEAGRAEHAGVDLHGRPYDVWVRFGASGAAEGDVCRPFGSLQAALAATADGGTIHLLPGSGGQRGSLRGGRRISVRLTAPLGGVSLR
jgi:hypothetical protein